MDEIKILLPSPFPPLPGEAPSGEALPPLRTGEQIQGRILERVDNSHFSLRLGGRTLVVESGIPLPVATDLTFRVEETGPRTLLRLIPEASPEEQRVFSFLKKALAADLTLESLAEKLSGLEKARWVLAQEKESWKGFLALLNRYSLAELTSRGAALLPGLFAQSGFFWEHKVKEWVEGGRKDSLGRLVQEDLKGLGLKLLARLKEFAEAPGPKAEDLREAQGLKQKLESFLQKIELHQVLNLRYDDSPHRFHLFLPFWMGNQMQFVEFNLSFPERDSSPGGRKGFSVLFLLNLPSLGKVRIEAQMEGKALFCRLAVSAPGVAEFLRQEIPLLKERLERLGFQPSIETAVEEAENIQAPFAQEREGESRPLLSVVI